MLQNFAIKIVNLCSHVRKFLSICAVIFFFNVLSNYLTVLLLRAFSHRVAKEDGAVVFYKAFYFSGSTTGPESGLAKR